VHFLFPSEKRKFPDTRRKDHEFFSNLFLKARSGNRGIWRRFSAYRPPGNGFPRLSRLEEISRFRASRLSSSSGTLSGFSRASGGPESVMSFDAASAARAAAADYREASRHLAHLRAVERADARRDQRIEEAKASAAVRSRPSDRAADLPEPRPRSSPKALLLDVLA
jgi:hypothetical protein